ncbi:MAG: beta-N-acetylhexosaminidase [Clostridia bacterium]|nr:beta-N-acetylhexosaminidase [Clostridia bacterium]
MNIKTLCAHIDCSRNAVMKKESLKEFLKILSKMGYNAVMLYTEDTYEIPEYPFFGYMRGRYTADDLREIDDFAAELGMELIPCIQVLGHLEMALKWDFLPKESIDIIMPDDERTYEFIDRALGALSGAIRSRKIHIGLDEAFGLGSGNLMKKNGYEPAISIIKRHLSRIVKIAEKYGYTMLAWSDMFFREWNDGAYWIEKKEIPAEVIASVPECVIPVYWDYYSTDFARYDAMLSNHKQLSENSWFAGAVWGWRGMIPYNNFSIKTMTPALDACEKNQTENIMICIWGDDGNECSRYSHLPALYYIAKYAQGEKDIEKIKQGFEETFGVPFDSYMEIDEPNRPGNPNFGNCDMNPSRHMLYSDYFNGFRDAHVIVDDEKYFAAYAKRLDKISDTLSPLFAPAFRSAAALCRVLDKKYALGVKTRAAYKSGDKAALAELIRDYYAPLPALIEQYHKLFKAQWDAENRPSGFDLQDLRLGGLLMRTKTCTQRLCDYVEGRLDKIDELEVELLEMPTYSYGKWRSGKYLFTPNVFEGT